MILFLLWNTKEDTLNTMEYNRVQNNIGTLNLHCMVQFFKYIFCVYIFGWTIPILCCRSVWPVFLIYGHEHACEVSALWCVVECVNKISVTIMKCVCQFDFVVKGSCRDLPSFILMYFVIYIHYIIRVFTLMLLADAFIRRNLHLIDGVCFYQFMHVQFAGNPWFWHCLCHALLFELPESTQKMWFSTRLVFKMFKC